MYAVTGAAGHTGRAAVTALRARGERVRAIVRTAERGKELAGPGVDVVAADLEDPEALARALSGVTGTFLVRPPATRAGGAVVARSFREALTRVDAGRIVVLSSIGAQHATGTGVVGGLHDLEQEVRQSGRPMTFLRAASFLENWLRMLGAVHARGVLPSLLPADFAFAQAAVADVGTTAATLLLDGADEREIVNVEGPAMLSANDVALAIGRKLGKAVSVFPMPPDTQQGQLEAAGVPGPYAREVVELYRGILDGTVSWPSGEPVARGTTTLDAWAAASV